MAVQRGIDKWKTKRWFTVYAPKIFNEEKVCEIPAADEKAVLNRKIKVSLDHLTHNPQHAVANVVLKVVDVNGDAAHTRLVMIEEVYSYVRSLVRRYRSVASAVIPISSKDNVKMTVKIIAITRARVTTARLRAIRKDLTDFITEYSKGADSGAIVGALVDGSLQSQATAKVSNIAPINKIEIRKLEIAS